MYINKYPCYFMTMFLFLFFLSVHSLYAEFAWPVPTESIQSVSSKYYENTFYTVVGTKGEVLSSVDGVVIVVRHENNVYNLPGMLVLKAENGFLFTYLYVHAHIKIGERVNVGMSIASPVQEDGKFFLIVYDTLNDRSIDSLLILPDIERAVDIKLYDFTFVYPNNERESITRKMKVGIKQLEITLNINEKHSDRYLIPYRITVTIADKVYELSRDDIISPDSPHSIDADGRIKIVLSDIVVKPGYRDIAIKTITPLRGFREHQFNVFFFVPEVYE